MLNGGLLDGRTYLSPEAVREMTRRHTPESWDRAQGIGFLADGKSFSHGGALGTHTRAHFASGLILGWLVQQMSFNGESAAAVRTFERAAIERFAGAHR